LGQRLQGDQRGQHDRGAAGIRSAGAPDRGRGRQAAGLLAAGAVGRAAMQVGVPDRRGRRGPQAGARGYRGATAPGRRPGARRVAPPLEHRILMTAALCLLAFGAVMVYSASSPLGVIGGRGYGTGEFVRYLVFGALGLAGMHVLARRGMELFNERMVRTLLI